MAGESPARRAREKSTELRKAEEEKARRRRALIQIGVIVALVVVVIGVTIALLSSNDDDNETPSGPVVTPSSANDNGGIYVGDTASSDAVTVTMVEDFQCPACRQFESQNSDLLEEYAAADSGVRLEYRPIAFLDGQSSTEYSSRAANAAFCVADQDAAYFLPFHNLLFENQPEEGGDGLPDDQLVEYAVEAGADETEVSSCVADRTYDGWIQQQTQKTFEEIEGTPSVFVDGELLENPTPERLAAAVEKAK